MEYLFRSCVRLSEELRCVFSYRRSYHNPGRTHVLSLAPPVLQGPWSGKRDPRHAAELGHRGQGQRLPGQWPGRQVRSLAECTERHIKINLAIDMTYSVILYRILRWSLLVVFVKSFGICSRSVDVPDESVHKFVSLWAFIVAPFLGLSLVRFSLFQEEMC